MEKRSHILLKLVPIMLAFFAMGFVDLVGIATNYVKKDFELSDSVANLFTSMVFFWFLVCSVPTGMLMNKIGRRKTVILSLVLTSVALIIPLIDYNLPLILISFSLLGISNAVMQVSLNPLLSNIVSDKRLSSALTFGQFVKAIAAFTAPIIAAWGALHFNNWRLLFAVYLVEGVIAAAALSFEKIKEEEMTGRASTFKECFSLLGDTTVLLCFIGIVCHVGIDVGTNVSAPRIIMDKLGLSLTEAGYATSVYFLFRTMGCLAGTFILANFSTRRFYAVSIFLLAAGMLGLLLFRSSATLYACIALIGFNNANLFPIMFSQAILHLPEKKNEISGLMIMGIFGGAVFPLLMGFASDLFGSQKCAGAIMGLGVVYLLSVIRKVRDTTRSRNDQNG